MKQRLQKIYWTGILVTLLMAAATAAGAAALRIADTRNYLTAMLEASSKWTLDTNADLQDLADSIADSSPPLRAVFLLDSGLVIADSMDSGTDSGIFHDHDPEIEAAREGKTGTAFRFSGRGGSLVLYMAGRVAPQLLLRLSYPVFETAKYLLFYGALLAVLFLVLHRLQRAEITRFAKDHERQMDEVRRLLDGEISDAEAVFPEYRPSLDSIAYRSRRLRDDREEILRTLNLRNDFIANASHELRSPLTSVRGYAEMLKEGLADTPEERELCLDMILSESGRMLEVIEDILLLSKAEKKTYRSEEMIHVRPLAEEAALSLGPGASKAGIDISCTGDMQVRAAEKDIWEILYNLTDNAVRYGKDGGYVRIVMEPGRIEVQDDGIGIAPEQIGHIFEQFYRVDETRESPAGGTGLGLSIVKAIVNGYGGRIEAESTDGEGTVFTVTFPEEVLP